MSRRSAWLVVVPVAFAGSELAHVLLNHLVVDADESGELVADGIQLVPVLALAGALAAVGLLARILDARPHSTRVSPWPFALLPVAIFVLQEHLELALAAGRPATPLAEREFYLGLALQVPFALSAAERLAGRLRAFATPSVAIAGPQPRPHVFLADPRGRRLAAAPTRGPPALSPA